MVENFGKLQMKMIDIPPLLAFKVHPDDPDVVMMPGRSVGQVVNAEGVPWRDVAKGKAAPGKWFIIVGPDGWIFSAEQDPEMLTLPDNDVLLIEHPGGHDDIIAHKWTGEEVVPWDAS